MPKWDISLRCVVSIARIASMVSKPYSKDSKHGEYSKDSEHGEYSKDNKHSEYSKGI